jgi:hypothetical protein
MALQRVRRSRMAATFSARFLTREPGCLGLVGVALVETLKVILELGVSEFDELRQRGVGEITILVVDRLDPGAVNRDQFPAKKIELAAEQHELTEDRAEGLVVDAAEISDRFEVRLQVAQQPNDFDVAMGLGFQTPARPNAIEVAVDVELQQVLRRIARAAGCLRLHPSEASGGQVQSIDEGVDEANRVVLADVFVG